MELAINVIGEGHGAALSLTVVRIGLAADDAFEAHGPHQAGNRAAGPPSKPSRCNCRQTLRTYTRKFASKHAPDLL